jgi:hypothetical protein
MGIMTIYAIKTNDGIFISDCAKPYSGHNLERQLFDGVLPQKTFMDQWFKVPSIPKKISRMVSQPNINRRLEIKDISNISEATPKVLDHKEVGVENDGDFIWLPKYENIKDLYEWKSDVSPPKEELYEFEIKILLEIDKIEEYTEFNYFSEEKHLNITRNNIEHQILDKILFPEPIVSMKPCKLSSEDSYKIIREYVKSNINPKAAIITSDYDFCFTVKKRVPLAKPYESSYEITTKTGRSYKPARYNKRYHSVKEVEFFEMTHSPYNYRGYTPIEGFYGTSESDLKNNIDKYLNELMDAINEPLKECECCNGIGVVKGDEAPRVLKSGNE